MLKLWTLIEWHIDRIFASVSAAILLTAASHSGYAESSKTAKPESSLFAQIADEGLSGTVCSGNLQIIKSACSEAHSDPDGKDWSDDSDAGVGRIFKYIDRQTTKILNLAGSANTNADDRAKALYRFGLVMRALEEFYLKSNYLELKIAADPNLDPYSIEPINWTKVGKDSRSIAQTGFKFGEFDKSSPKSPLGAKKLANATYFSMAKELSVREAQREWNTIERLIRVRYPQKAGEIAIALKNASCPDGFKPDAED